MKDLPGYEPVSFNGLVGLPPRGSVPRGCGSVFRTRLTLSTHQLHGRLGSPTDEEPRRQTSGTHPGAAARNNSCTRSPEPVNDPFSAIFDAR